MEWDGKILFGVLRVPLLPTCFGGWFVVYVYGIFLFLEVVAYSHGWLVDCFTG